MTVKSKFRLPLPSPRQYVPPFVTQLGEPSVDDCVWTSGLMLVATWTLGEVVTKKNGRPMGKRDLCQLHRELRSASGDLGDSNLSHLATGVHKVWPQLRSLEPFMHGGDWGRPIAFDGLWTRLQSDDCAVVQGNPSGVTDPNSALHTTTANHAVFVHHAEGEVAFVQDPMRPHETGKSQMRKVGKEDLRQFTEWFDSGPFCMIVKRGGEAPAKRARRRFMQEVEPPGSIP